MTIGLAALAAAVLGCKDVDTEFREPVHLQALLATSTGPDDVRLYGTGFGDNTLRSWTADDALELDQVIWSGGSVEPVNVGSVGPSVAAGFLGVWDLIETSSNTLAVTTKLSGALHLMSSGSGPLRTVASMLQGTLVEHLNPAVGLAPARGLDRVGPVVESAGWLYTGGLDGLGIYHRAAESLTYGGVAADLSGADDLLALPAKTTTATESRSRRILLSRCRRRVVDAACFSPTEEAELVVARREERGNVSVLTRWAYRASSDDGRETLLGDGSLATVSLPGAREVVVAAFEGSATVVGLTLTEQDSLTPLGRRRIVAPWQDPTALPAFNASVVSTSTLAPLRAGQVATLGQTIFVAVRSGGFVAHFPLPCLSQPLETEGCLDVTCLDETGGCAGPSDASLAPTYPHAVTTAGNRAYVGVDVRGVDGTISSRIAILEVDEAGAVTLIGIFDA